MTSTTPIPYQILIRDLKKRYYDLKDLCGDLHSKPPSLESQVQFGQILWDMSRLISGSLEGIKKYLREEALMRTDGKPGSIQLEAPDGARCTVTIPPPQVLVDPQADFAALKVLLGNELFQDLFEETQTYKPRKNFRQLVKEKKEARVAMSAVRITEDPPRISFKS